MAVRLAADGPGLVSDRHPALIAMYRAVRAGWDPPSVLTEEQWRAARDLPDSDPLKAFAGFGCSFGGKYFEGYARSGARNYAGAARRALLRDLPALRGCTLACVDFFDVPPTGGLLLYLDPPYAGTTDYGAAFDSARLWTRAREWAREGSSVFVSEYACPDPSIAVAWERDQLSTTAIGSGRPRTERLYHVEP